MRRLRRRAEAFDSDTDPESEATAAIPTRESAASSSSDYDDESSEDEGYGGGGGGASARASHALEGIARGSASHETGTGGSGGGGEAGGHAAAPAPELSSISFAEREKMRKCGFDDRDTLARRAQELAHERRRTARAARMGGAAKRNKNAPREMSSRVPVGRFRDTPLPEGLRQRVQRKPSRDPRFSELSGTLNEDLFEKSYAFLEERRERDIEQLQGLLGESKDERKRRVAQKQLTRLQQQQHTHKTNAERKQRKRQRRQQEAEAVSQGKRAFFLKKSDQKKAEVEQRYEELKKTGKLQKFMAKKRKRNAAKERKRGPAMLGEQ
eukprot:g3527.t1